jgi:hypothetical protein
MAFRLHCGFSFAVSLRSLAETSSARDRLWNRDVAGEQAIGHGMEGRHSQWDLP